ncbi:MAG TPA: PilN domain-containing protein, partial [Thermoanaerobaculia bacterium]|nr:PilN domain-containing protein [Thermoanaerobaculia bacterium]
RGGPAGGGMSIAPDNDLSFDPPPAPPQPAPVRAPAAPAGNPRADSLNLAGRPFGNSRPVVRISLLLWLLGLALLLGNVFVFRNYLSDSADKRAQIAHGEKEILRQQKDVADLQARLNGYDLVRLNDQIDFLNTQIDARTFSWSLLIDRITDTLPNDVRLNHLAPVADAKTRGETRGRSGPRDRTPQGEVQLHLSGQTRRDGALIQFVNNLFAHPSFRDPNLIQESQVDTGGPLVKFEATVTYLPGGPPHGVVVEESPAGTAPGTKKKTTTTSKALKKTTTTTAPTTPAPGGRP